MVGYGEDMADQILEAMGDQPAQPMPAAESAATHDGKAAHAMSILARPGARR
jgi:hypothetical protein